MKAELIRAQSATPMIPELDEITAIENGYRPPGKPTLGDAYTLLKTRWQAGKRDLETGLRLLFLAWYSCAEPPFLPGLPTTEDTCRVVREVFAYFGGTSSTEPEILHAMGLLCEICPTCMGTYEEGIAVGVRCRKAARELNPHGYPPEHFENRGAYGDYFAHMARVVPPAP
jgi:hypothetical protein